MGAEIYRSTRSNMRIITAWRRDNFIGGDIHDGPMPIDYFVWVIQGAGRTIVVDTGFDRAMAEKRGREIVRSVEEGLTRIGVDPARSRTLS